MSEAPRQHRNVNCALVNFAGEGPYESCSRCTLRIQNCIQFRGQLITAVILVLVAASVVPVMPHAGSVALVVLAGACTLYYLKYVANESQTSIFTQWELSHRSRALEVVNARLLEEKAASERLQDQLRQAQQLEALGRLAAGVAHEINNPLTYVIGNLELLSEIVDRAGGALDPSDRADAHAAVHDVKAGTQRIARIVQDIKLFSRQRDDDRRNVELVTVVDETVRMMRRQVEERARLVVVTGPTPPVFASAGRLVQVLSNLLTNATHAVSGPPNANEIRIELWTDHHGSAVVEVRDTGAGIAPDKLARIFDPFFTTKPAGQGTGLGLAICRSILAGYGATIEVASEVGQGTRFRITLPASTQQDPALPSETPDPLVGDLIKGARILVIDDDAPVVRLLCALLSEAEVTPAHSAADALPLLAEGSFDVVICDIHMPEVSGVELFHAVRERHPGLERRFVFSTGGSYGADLLNLLELVDNPVLEKPYTQARARTVIASWLQAVGRARSTPDRNAAK